MAACPGTRTAAPTGKFRWCSITRITTGYWTTLVAKSYPQSVSGTAWDASSGQPLTNAVIVLAMQQGNSGGGTVADTNGNFALPFAPGNYAVIATKNGWVGNQNTLV